MESKHTVHIWQPTLRSEIEPPTELLYHYIRLFSAQNKQLLAWHALRWLHAAHTTARSLDNASPLASSGKAVSVLKQSIEKGWLFVTNPPLKRMTEDDVIVDGSFVPPPAPEGFLPPIDLLYNYADQLATQSLTKTCWHLFEWLQVAFNRACKKDMNPYATGPTATALKAALAECRIAASPKDVPYMPDSLKKRCTLGFDERYVTVEVVDRLWDRLPAQYQIEILELGRRPQTPRDRYGGYATMASITCNHRKVSPPALLADGGCACPDREDVSWSDLPSFERSLFAEPNTHASQMEDEQDDVASMTDGESALSSDVDDGRDMDQDSAYESEEDDADGDGDNGRCTMGPAQSSSGATGKKHLDTKLVLRLGRAPQQVDFKMRQWFLRTLSETARKRARVGNSELRYDDDSDDETERRDSKRRHY